MAGDLGPNSAIVHRCHVTVAQAVLELFEGFFVNFEDALFEYAYRSESKLIQQRCFNLMRELREQREDLTHVFASVLERRRLDWYRAEQPLQDATLARASTLAATANANFLPLLEQIAARMSGLDAAELGALQMPVGPTGVAHAFLLSLRARGFDKSADRMLGALFRRFVLDRLGPIYGELNLHLMRLVALADDPAVSNSAG